MADTTTYVQDENGNQVEVTSYTVRKSAKVVSAKRADGLDIRYLYDDVSGRFFPITCKSAIIGGVGRGSSRVVTDYSEYLLSKYTGTYTMYTINDYIKYYYLDIVYEEGTLTEGDNIISEALPVTDIPENDIVFRTYVDEDSSCRYTLFLNSSDGKIHCIVIPLYEVSIENDVLKKTALIASTSISAQAICLTA